MMAELLNVAILGDMTNYPEKLNDMRILHIAKLITIAPDGDLVLTDSGARFIGIGELCSSVFIETIRTIVDTGKIDCTISNSRLVCTLILANYVELIAVSSKCVTLEVTDAGKALLTEVLT